MPVSEFPDSVVESIKKTHSVVVRSVRNTWVAAAIPLEPGLPGHVVCGSSVAFAMISLEKLVVGQ